MLGFIVLSASALLSAGSTVSGQANVVEEESILVQGNRPAHLDDQILCRNIASTGTRVTKRVCISRAAREQLQEEHRRLAREMIDRPVIEIRR